MDRNSQPRFSPLGMHLVRVVAGRLGAFPESRSGDRLGKPPLAKYRDGLNVSEIRGSYIASTTNLAACALGVGDSDLFARLAGTDPQEESSVGELLLGSRPA